MLDEALHALPFDDRWLVRLRFEQDLTLEELARLFDLDSPQRVHRRLEKILNVLRKRIGQP